MKRSILFVDDEPKILAGLRRTLRGLRHEWHMEFVEGAREALDRLAALSFDVVVTDMRMPGMDGAELLGEVMKRSPATVRIILSGQCDRQAILRCVGPAHQFLAKPCDPETLKSAVALACGLRDRLACAWQERMVSRVQSLPSRPSACAALVAELESDEASVQQVAQIVSQDVAMTAKTLQLVSSGFFGTPQRIAKLAQAVDFLGLDTIQSLATSTETFFPLDADPAEARWLERLTEHSLAVGTAAQAIAESETKDPVLVADALLAGLLHDVGTLMFAQHLLDQSLSTWDPSRLEPPPVWDVAEQILRAGHADVGACLMALWGLPDPIVEAIAYHRSPRVALGGRLTPLAAVHVANAFLEEIMDVAGVRSPMDVDYLEQIGLSHRVESWREICYSAVPEGVPQ